MLIKIATRPWWYPLLGDHWLNVRGVSHTYPRERASITVALSLIGWAHDYWWERRGWKWVGRCWRERLL